MRPIKVLGGPKGEGRNTGPSRETLHSVLLRLRTEKVTGTKTLVTRHDEQ